MPHPPATPAGPSRGRDGLLRRVEETSAGGLVVDLAAAGARRRADRPPTTGAAGSLWSLPKGHVEAGRDRRGRGGPRGRGGDRHPRPRPRPARHHRLLVRRRGPPRPQDRPPLPARGRRRRALRRRRRGRRGRVGPARRPAGAARPTPTSAGCSNACPRCSRTPREPWRAHRLRRPRRAASLSAHGSAASRSAPLPRPAPTTRSPQQEPGAAGRAGSAGPPRSPPASCVASAGRWRSTATHPTRGERAAAPVDSTVISRSAAAAEQRRVGARRTVVTARRVSSVTSPRAAAPSSRPAVPLDEPEASACERRRASTSTPAAPRAVGVVVDSDRQPARARTRAAVGRQPRRGSSGPASPGSGRSPTSPTAAADGVFLDDRTLRCRSLRGAAAPAARRRSAGRRGSRWSSTRCCSTTWLRCQDGYRGGRTARLRDARRCRAPGSRPPSGSSPSCARPSPRRRPPRCPTATPTSQRSSARIARTCSTTPVRAAPPSSRRCSGAAASSPAELPPAGAANGAIAATLSGPQRRPWSSTTRRGAARHQLHPDRAGLGCPQRDGGRADRQRGSPPWPAPAAPGRSRRSTAPASSPRPPCIARERPGTVRTVVVLPPRHWDPTDAALTRCCGHRQRALARAAHAAAAAGRRRRPTSTARR